MFLKIKKYRAIFRGISLGMEKIILHVDMDAFFAAVEQLDNVSYRNKPVIVGGVSERGVVSTCSYEARKFGIHSAMPIFMAQKACPQGIYILPRMGRYKEVSNRIFSILREVTEFVEPLSIDEAYLDISNSEFKDGMEAALYIKERVYKEVGLTLSIGISYNKFLAKIASEWNKPNGIKEIDKSMVPEILFPLSISKIHGLGEKSVAKLNNMGIFKIKELYNMPMEFFLEYLGKSGIEIFDRIRGNDFREIDLNRDRKSYGKERTLKFNTDNKEELILILEDYAKEISSDLKRHSIEGRTITLKYKTASFENHSRSKTLNFFTNEFQDIFNVSKELLEVEEIESIRLIGITVSSLKEKEIEQLTLF